MVPLNFYQLLEGHKREQAFFCNSPAKINLRHVIFNHGKKNKQALLGIERLFSQSIYWFYASRNTQLIILNPLFEESAGRKIMAWALNKQLYFSPGHPPQTFSCSTTIWRGSREKKDVAS
jgi:hypothetical protein